MWSCDDETPPTSPRLVCPPRPPHASRQGSCGSSCYKTLESERSVVATDQAEDDFGWGGNAGAFRRENAPLRPDTGASHSNTAATSRPMPRRGITISALVDPRDMVQPAQEQTPTSPPPHANSRAKLYLKIRHILLRLCLHEKQSVPAPISQASSRKSQAWVNEMADMRLAREKTMMKRKARGSIVYSRETGIAQIPLYSAPDLAQVSQAPALSSFAPIAPLGTKQTESKTIAKAAATLTADGRLLEVKKQAPFEKGKARYSKWIQKAT